MKTEHAKAIADAAIDIGLDVTHREGYSGRGMYGRTTDGIVGNPGHIIQAIAAAAHKMGYDEGLSQESNGDEFVDAMGKLSFDNMGCDQIVY